MDYLRESIRLAVESGIAEDKIIIDPGIGFGKTFDHNLEIIKTSVNLHYLKNHCSPEYQERHS